MATTKPKPAPATQPEPEPVDPFADKEPLRVEFGGTDEGLTASAAIADGIRSDQADKTGEKAGFRDWALQIPEPKTGKLNFNVFPFQSEMYDEFGYDKEGCVQKGTQVGMSAWLVRWAMYWADVYGLTVLYVFPTQKTMHDFADARIRTLILGSAYLRERIPLKYVQNKGLRAIGRGLLYCRGSESERELESVDADAIALDEFDLLAPSSIPVVERRLSSPLSRGLMRSIGWPSVPEWGIAKLYEASDKRQWMVRCTKCREWQPITFYDNVDQKRLLVVCKHCTKPLDVKKGMWVAEHPDRDSRGYHVHRLLLPGAAHLPGLIEASKRRSAYEVQVFWNRDLGLPFAPKEGRLSREAIAACQRDYFLAGSPGYVGDSLVTMGVDVASVRDIHVRISEHFTDRSRRALYIGTVESFDEVVKLMDRYGVKMACVDHLPEGRLARGLAERFYGRVYVTNLSGPPTQLEPVKVNPDDMTITAKRTEVCDAVMTVIRDQRNLLPLDLPEGYVEHMMAPVRFVDKDELGKTQVGFRSMGPDDFFFAEAYDLIALDAFWIRKGMEEAQREEITSLDSLLEFQRSAANVPEESTYRPGPDREYGDEEDEWRMEGESWEG
jgi:hypothetical protein